MPRYASTAGSIARVRPRARRAVALLLVTIAVIVSSIIAYTYLAAQETSIGIARNIKNHAQARYIAESGLNLTMDYIKSDDNWRTNRPLGVWATNIAFGAGAYTVRCDDGYDANGDGAITVPGEGDGDLTNKGTDVITLTITGSVNGSTHVLHNVVRPLYTGPTVLFIVGNDSSLTTAEQERKTLMEGWSWQVNLLDDDSSQSQFDSAVADVDLALVSASASNVGTKLKSEGCGVVNEYGPASNSFGFSQNNANYTKADDNQIDIINGSHYITSPYGVTTLTVATVGNLRIDDPGGTLAGGLASLAQKKDANNIALATIESGAALYGSGTAAARRVSFPFGRWLISQLNSDGVNLLRRSLEWASGEVAISAFGFQTAFAGTQGSVKNKQIATQVVLTEDGTLTSISAYIKADKHVRSYRYALYSDSSGQPGSLIVQTAVNTATVSDKWRWLQLPVTATSLNAGTYWLALCFNEDQLSYRFRDKTGQTRYNTNNAITGSFSSTWGSSSSTLTRQIDIFGTYTPASGSTGSGGPGVGTYSYDDVDLR
jgi:hypothetical protein